MQIHENAMCVVKVDVKGLNWGWFVFLDCRYG